MRVIGAVVETASAAGVARPRKISIKLSTRNRQGFADHLLRSRQLARSRCIAWSGVEAPVPCVRGHWIGECRMMRLTAGYRPAVSRPRSNCPELPANPQRGEIKVDPAGMSTSRDRSILKLMQRFAGDCKFMMSPPIAATNGVRP